MEKVKLGEIFNLQMGKTPSRNNNKYWQNGIYDWVAISDLGNFSKYTNKTKEQITDIAIKESCIKIIPTNTVIMSFKLSVGKTAITNGEVYTNEAIMAFLPKEKYDIFPDYFYYLFSSKDWSKETNRAVMGNTLNKATLSQIKISLPPIAEQQKIADTLDKVTDLIDKRKQELEKLDILIKAKFVEMFGELYYNEKLWDKCTFKDICTVRQGLQIPISKRLNQNEDNCYQYITIAFLNGSKKAEYIKNPNKNVICNKNDILMTRTGNTGMVITDVEGVFHNNFFLIDFDRSKYNRIFLKYYLELDFIQSEILKRAGSSTIPDLNHSEFYKIKLFIIPIKLQNQFAEFVEKTEKIKTDVQKSLETLETLKKSLMQEYFE